jgi:hypothetical protein
MAFSKQQEDSVIMLSGIQEGVQEAGQFWLTQNKNTTRVMSMVITL